MVMTDDPAGRSRRRILFPSHGRAFRWSFGRSIVPVGDTKPWRSVPACPLIRRTTPWSTGTVSARSRQTVTCDPICRSELRTTKWPAPSKAWARGSPLILLLSVAAALSGCSREPSDARQSPGAQPSALSANPIGEQRYSCNDGSQWHVDSLSDGLTITLTRMPGGKQERLDAPAQGLTFVGDRIAVTFKSDRMTIERSEGPAVSCRRN